MNCVHCQDFPHCRKDKNEAFYGVLDCGCSDCDCGGEYLLSLEKGEVKP